MSAPYAAGRGEHRQADRLDDGDEEGAGGMGKAADLLHRLEQADDGRLGRDDAGDRAHRGRPASAPGPRGPWCPAAGPSADERDLGERQVRARRSRSRSVSR